MRMTSPKTWRISVGATGYCLCLAVMFWRLWMWSGNHKVWTVAVVANICTFANRLLLDATDDLDDLNFFNQKKKKKKPKKIFDIDEAEEGVKVCFHDQAILSIARNLLAFIFLGIVCRGAVSNLTSCLGAVNKSFTLSFLCSSSAEYVSAQRHLVWKRENLTYLQ